MGDSWSSGMGGGLGSRGEAGDAIATARRCTELEAQAASLGCRWCVLVVGEPRANTTSSGCRARAGVLPQASG